MNRLPQVLIVFSVLIAGALHGHYNYSLQMGHIPWDTGFTEHVGNTVRILYKDKKEEAGKGDTGSSKDKGSNQAQADFGVGPASEPPPPEVEWEWELAEKDRPEAPPVAPPIYPEKRFPKQSELDKVDSLVKEAEIYLRVATISHELQKDYAQKALKTTDEALDIIDRLIEQCGRLPEIIERLQSVTDVRKDAVKLDHAR